MERKWVGALGSVRALCTLEPHTGSNADLTQPELVASGGLDGAIRIWKILQLEQPFFEYRAHAGPVVALCGVTWKAFPAVASIGQDNALCIWDRTTCTVIDRIEFSLPPRAICSHKTATGRSLLAVAGHGWLRTIDAGSTQTITVIQDYKVGNIRALSAVRHRDGRERLVASGRDNLDKGWGISQFSDEGKLELVYNRLISGLASVPVELPDGRTLVVTNFDVVDPWQEVEMAPLYASARKSPVRHFMHTPANSYSLTVINLRDGRPAVVGGGPYGELTLWDIQADFDYDEPSYMEPRSASGERDSFRERREKVLISTAEDQELYVRALTPIQNPSSDGANLVVSAGNDGFLRVWDPNDWSEARPPCPSCHSGPVTSLAIATPTSGNTRIFSGDTTGALWEWNANSGELMRGPLLSHAGIGEGVAVVRSIPAENVVVAGGGSSELVTWPISEGMEPINRIRCGQEYSPYGGVHDIIPVDVGGKKNVVASEHGKVSLWERDSLSWKQIGAIKLFSNADQVLALRLPDNTYTIAMLENRTIWLCPLGWVEGHREPNEDEDEDESDNDVSKLHALTYDYWGECIGVVTDETGHDLLCCGRFDGVDIYDPANGIHTRSIDGSGRVTAIHSWGNPSGQIIMATGNESGEIITWNFSTGTPEKWVHAHVGAVRALDSIAGDETPHYLVSAGDDGVISLWDPTAFDRLAVGTSGFSDRPAQNDLLNRGAIVDVLSELLHTGTPPSELFLGQDPGPTVISIEGSWGSGKTTLMRLLEHRVRSRSSQVKTAATTERLTPARAVKILNQGSGEDNSEPSTDPVSKGSFTIWFDPWAHQSGEQIWAGLARAIMEAAAPVLYPTVDSREQYWYRRNVRRVDAEAVRRKLRKGSVSPLLRAGAVAVLLPIFAQILLKLNSTPPNLTILGVQFNTLMAIFLIPLALVVGGSIHSIGRYYRGSAASILDPALVLGPLQPADLTTLGDPFYGAHSGYLYLVQHDVARILSDLANRGYAVIVFVDDLDRCAPPTTAAVFEAINLFLSGILPPARFVIGLDPAVIVEHIDQSYTKFRDLPASRHPGDPTLGWTFLRKLIQLPVPLPIPADEKIEGLLEGMLGAEESIHSPATERNEVPRVGERNQSIDAPSTRGRGDERADPSTSLKSTSLIRPSDLLPPNDQYRTTPRTSVKQTVGMLERNPEVRSVFRDVIAGLPDWNAREVKRLVNMWQYCARVIERRQPAEGNESIERAKNLIILSEILTRWPAYVRTFGKRVGESFGLYALATAAMSDSRWRDMVNELGFQSEHDLKAMREVLRKQGGLAAANLFELLYRV